MAREIFFEIEFDYNTLETGIVLPAKLILGEEESDDKSKTRHGRGVLCF